MIPVECAYIVAAFLCLVAILSAAAWYSLGRMDERAQGRPGEPWLQPGKN